MVFELPEPEDFTDHPSIVSGLNMFKQHTIVGSWASEQGQ
jgi:hypothetical protein